MVVAGVVVVAGVFVEAGVVVVVDVVVVAGSVVALVVGDVVSIWRLSCRINKSFYSYFNSIY